MITASDGGTRMSYTVTVLETETPATAGMSARKKSGDVHED